MEHIRHLAREFSTGPEAVLHIEARSGAVLVEAHDADNVLVDAELRVWTDHEYEVDEAAAQVERGMEQDGHRVILRTPQLPQREGWSALFGARGSRVDYRVRVPRRTAARVLTRSGRTAVRGLHGRVHIEARSGKVSVEDIVGDVAVVSHSGHLEIERVQGDVSAEARSGRLRLRQIDGAAVLDARSGSIEAGAVTGDVKIIARTGTVTVEDAGARLFARCRCGTFRYRGKVAGDFDIENHTGTITLAVDTETPFFIDAESSVGTVRSDLPPRRGAGGGGQPSGPKVRLRAHTGSILLKRAD